MDSILRMFIADLLSLDIFYLVLGEILAETSLTLLSVASVIDVVPDIFPFQYGMTFFKTLFSVLPIGWLSDDFFLNAYSTYVINTYTKIPVGSSFIGSLYWNYGYVGVAIAAFLCGIYVPQILYKLRGSIRKSCVIYFSLFAQMIMLVRCELIDIFRYLVMLFVLMFALECFFKRRG